MYVYECAALVDRFSFTCRVTFAIDSRLKTDQRIGWGGRCDDGFGVSRVRVWCRVMAEGKLEIDVRAKTSTALNLRVRLRTSAAHHRLSGSVRACFRTWVVRVSLTLLPVLPARHAPRRATSRIRKLWLRIRGKHHVETSAIPQASNLAPVKKPRWSRTLSTVGNQLLLRKNSSSKEKIVSQERENGFVDALRSDRAVMAMHGVGMASTLIVLMQLTGLPLFVILAIAGRIVFVNRHSSSFGLRFQQLWQEATSIGAISLVPQALGVVLRPYLPQSGEGVMGTITLILVLLARYQRLPFKAFHFFGVLSAGGIPAILVLWAPIVQLWNCWWSPADVSFMQILTGLVAVVSNCFLGYLRNGNILLSTS